MSKLKQALIPGYGANPTKPNSNPLSGLAPDPETGLPVGMPKGLRADALKYSNPVGGFAPDVNGDIGYQKGWLDRSSNGTPPAPPKGPAYNVWADPDVTQRGWGWGMGADGALHTGVVGGGPAGSPWGPQDNASATPQGSPAFGQQLAMQMRQQGPAMAPGGPQGGPPMGMPPQQGMPPVSGAAAPAGMGQANPQGAQSLIAQLRMQQQGRAQPGQLGSQ